MDKKLIEIPLDIYQRLLANAGEKERIPELINFMLSEHESKSKGDKSLEILNKIFKVVEGL